MSGAARALVGWAWQRILPIIVIAGIAIAPMVTAAPTAWASDDTVAATASPGSLPPSWNGGQRVEVPDAGLAMTFPADWVVKLLEEGSEPDFIILARPGRFGPEVELQRILVAEGPDMQARDTFTFCTLVRYTPIDRTADGVLREVFRQADDLVVERLDEHLSRVLVNPWISSRIMVDTPEAIYVDHFAIGTAGAVAVMLCHGVASHRDDWLAIAESFEDLALEVRSGARGTPID